MDHAEPDDERDARLALGPWRSVADGVWVAAAEPDSVNVGLVVGSTGALLVDTGSTPEQGRTIRAAVAQVTDRPLTAVVVTHAHFDHAFGLAAFADLTTIGHESLAGWLTGPAAAADADVLGVDPGTLAPPSRGLVLATWVDLGDRRVEVAHLGRGHTGSDLVVVVPDADVLFVGDLVETAGPPAFGPDSWVHEWATTVDSVIGLMTDKTLAVPGHGEPADREVVFGERGRIASVSGEVRRLAETGVRVEDAAARGSWPYPAARIEPALAAAYAQLGPISVRRTLPLA